jgi:hypothetical protein
VEFERDKFLLSDNKALLQIERIHTYLSKEAYWCQGIPLDFLTKAIEASLCFGVFHSGTQIGFARVVTDSATFAWLCDVTAIKA